MEIKKCIIPIAGKGTRFLPITKTVSKEMLPIVDKPTIMLQVLEAYHSGINEIIFVVGEHNKNIVQDFFRKNIELEEFIKDEPSKLKLLDELNELITNVKFHYVVQDETFRGTAGALYQAKGYIEKGEYFAVMFGDDLIDAEVPVIKQLIENTKKYDCNTIGVTNVKKEDVSKYGIVRLDEENYILEFVEKPSIEEAPSTLASSGRYIINQEVFDIIPSLTPLKNNEYILVDTISKMTTKTQAFEYEGTYYDIGNKLGYIKANINFGMKYDGIESGLLEYLDTIRK